MHNIPQMLPRANPHDDSGVAVPIISLTVMSN